MNKIRIFTRILAIPFLILFCILGLLQTILWFIFCLCDLKPDEWEIFIDAPLNLIREYLKEGVSGI